MLNVQSLTYFFHAQLLYLSGPSSRAGTMRCAEISLFLQKKEIIYGVLTDSPSCLTLNHLILSGKYLLYINALVDKKYQFTDFITLVKEKIDIEKYIAVMSNNRTAFEKKWSLFIT